MSQPIAPQMHDPIPTRYSLLSRLQDWGDQASWKDFFDTYWELIYSVARKSGLTDTEAQDVVQETIICVAKDITKFKRDRQFGSFKGWLRNITRWRISDQLRKRISRGEAVTGLDARNPLPCDITTLPDPRSDEAESLWESEWKAHLLEAAVRRLKHRIKEEHFQIFDLCVVKQWPVRKIAQTLGISAAQVYLVKHRVSSLVRKEVRYLEKKWD